MGMACATKQRCTPRAAQVDYVPPTFSLILWPAQFLSLSARYKGVLHNCLQRPLLFPSLWSTLRLWKSFFFIFFLFCLPKNNFWLKNLKILFFENFRNFRSRIAIPNVCFYCKMADSQRSERDFFITLQSWCIYFFFKNLYFTCPTKPVLSVNCIYICDHVLVRLSAVRR